MEAQAKKPNRALGRWVLVVALFVVSGIAIAGWVLFLTTGNDSSPPAEESARLLPRQILYGSEGAVFTPEVIARDAFAALWLASQQANYRVVYRTSSDTGEPGDGYVVFSLPPAGRIDTLPYGDDVPSSQIFVLNDGSTFACLPDADKPCGEIAPLGEHLPLVAGPIILPAPASFASSSVDELENQTVAGAPARCFRVQLPDSADFSDYCFSENAVPVYARGQFGIVEAFEVGDAAEEDLALPTP